MLTVLCFFVFLLVQNSKLVDLRAAGISCRGFLQFSAARQWGFIGGDSGFLVCSLEVETRPCVPVATIKFTSIPAPGRWCSSSSRCICGTSGRAFGSPSWFSGKLLFTFEQFFGEFVRASSEVYMRLCVPLSGADPGGAGGLEPPPPTIFDRE